MTSGAGKELSRLNEQISRLMAALDRISGVSATIRHSVAASCEMMTSDPQVSALLAAGPGSVAVPALSALFGTAADRASAPSVAEVDRIVRQAAVVVAYWSQSSRCPERAFATRLTLELGRKRIHSLVGTVSLQLAVLEQAVEQVLQVVIKRVAVDYLANYALRNCLEVIFLPGVKYFRRALFKDRRRFRQANVSEWAGKVHEQLLAGLHRPSYSRSFETGPNVRGVDDELCALAEAFVDVFVRDPVRGDQ